MSITQEELTKVIGDIRNEFGGELTNLASLYVAVMGVFNAPKTALSAEAWESVSLSLMALIGHRLRSIGCEDNDFVMCCKAVMRANVTLSLLDKAPD